MKKKQQYSKVVSDSNIMEIQKLKNSIRLKFKKEPTIREEIKENKWIF